MLAPMLMTTSPDVIQDQTLSIPNLDSGILNALIEKIIMRSNDVGDSVKKLDVPDFDVLLNEDSSDETTDVAHFFYNITESETERHNSGQPENKADQKCLQQHVTASYTAQSGHFSQKLVVSSASTDTTKGISCLHLQQQSDFQPASTLSPDFCSYKLQTKLCKTQEENVGQKLTTDGFKPQIAQQQSRTSRAILSPVEECPSFLIAKRVQPLMKCSTKDSAAFTMKDSRNSPSAPEYLGDHQPAPPVHHSATPQRSSVPVHDTDLESQDGSGAVRLFRFILDELEKPDPVDGSGRLLEWQDRPRGLFRIVDKLKLAAKWGSAKNNKSMTYEKFSRSLRYYYKVQMLEKVPGKHLVYQFGSKAHREVWERIKPPTLSRSTTLPSLKVEPESKKHQQNQQSFMQRPAASVSYLQEITQSHSLSSSHPSGFAPSICDVLVPTHFPATSAPLLPPTLLSTNAATSPRYLLSSMKQRRRDRCHSDVPYPKHPPAPSSLAQCASAVNSAPSRCASLPPIETGFQLEAPSFLCERQLQNVCTGDPNQNVGNLRSLVGHARHNFGDPQQICLQQDSDTEMLDFLHGATDAMPVTQSSQVFVNHRQVSVTEAKILETSWIASQSAPVPFRREDPRAGTSSAWGQCAALSANFGPTAHKDVFRKPHFGTGTCQDSHFGHGSAFLKPADSGSSSLSLVDCDDVLDSSFMDNFP